MNRKKLLEMLAKIKATQAAKRGEIAGLMQKSLEAGETPNAEDEATIQNLEAEIKALGTNYARVEDMIKGLDGDDNSTAEPVAGGDEIDGIKSAPTSNHQPVVTVKALEKGLGFAMAVKCLAISKGSPFGAVEVAKSAGLPEQVQKYLSQKALVGTTGHAEFAKPLVDEANLTSEFIELLRPATVMGQMSGFRSVPFNVKVPTQVGATAVTWVGEGAEKPTTDMKFGQTTLGFAKVAGIVVLSQELMRFSSPAADVLVRDDMVKTVSQFLDQQFVDPTKAEAPESPASILNGVAPIASTGTTAAAYDADLGKMVAEFVSTNQSLQGAYWLMSETRAIQLSLLRDALGNTYFQGMGLTGSRSLLGLPVIASEAIGDKIILVKPGNILLADDGGVDIAYSDQATIKNGADTLSLFQQNLIGIRAERYIRWKAARKAASWINYAAP